MLLALVVFAWLNPWMRFWGLHHLAFLPRPLSIALVVFALLLLTPYGGRVMERLRKSLSKFAGRSVMMWSLAAMLVFFSLRVSIPLLGDGSLWIKELCWVGVFEARGKDVAGKRWLMRKEPLELGLHEVVFRGVAQFRPRDFPGFTPEQREAMLKRRSQWLTRAAQYTYSVLSIIAGGLFVFMTVRFARRRIAPELRALFLLMLYSASGMLFFFGYVENYSWMSLAAVAALFAGIDESRTPRRFPIKTVALFVLAVAFHLSAVVLLPGVLFLVLMHVWPPKENTEAAQTVRLRAGVIAAGFALIGVVGYVLVKGWKGWVSVMPLLPALSKDGYALLTLRHAADLANLFALSALAAAVVLIGLRRVGSARATERTQNAFLALAAAGGIAMIATFNPNLGMARDWDIVTGALWPLVVWAAWRLATSEVRSVRAELIAALTAFALLIVVPFVLVQTGKTSSLTRFETLLRMDHSRSAYGWENIAAYYEERNDLENRIRCWKSALAAENNPRYAINVGVALRLKGELVESERYIMEAVKRAPKYAYQLIYLAAEWSSRKNLDKARDLVERAIALDPKDKNAPRLLEKLNRDIARRDSLARGG